LGRSRFIALVKPCEIFPIIGVVGIEGNERAILVADDGVRVLGERVGHGQSSAERDTTAAEAACNICAWPAVKPPATVNVQKTVLGVD
jgi:hypothetical protein